MAKLLKILLGLVLLAGAATGVYAYSRGRRRATGAEDRRGPVGSITEKAIAVGQIQPRQKFQVKSKISGHRPRLPRRGRATR